MAIIGALPVTLANGTTADATQVMSDFNFVVSQVNANAAALATTPQLNTINTFTQPQIIPNAVTSSQVTNAAQIQQNNLTYFVDTGAVNAYVVTAAPAWGSYITGSELYVKIGNTNTAASTINVSALGLKNILNEDGSTPSPSSLIAGQVYHLIYDGTQFEIIGSSKLGVQGANIASAATVNLENATGDYVHVTGTTAITAITLLQGHEITVVFDGAALLTNGASLILRNGINRTAVAGETVQFRGEAAGVVREITTSPTKQPTRQVFLSGSGTYTTPSGAIRLYTRLVGAGGGGAGSGSAPGSGGAGGNTTFSTLTGGGGGGSAAGAYGAASTATGGDANLPGGGGGQRGSGANQCGGNGYPSPFGGGGVGGGSTTNTNGTAGPTNTGSGGGGGGSGATTGPGGGGGAGGYVEKIIAPPAATYSYGVGAAGAAGAAGAGGDVGGAGGSGLIIVDEYYS